MPMRFFIVILVAFSTCSCLNAQDTFNLDFEQLDRQNSSPVGWSWNSENQEGYRARIDSVVRQHGQYALSLELANSSSYAVCSYLIKPGYKGWKITLKGYMKTENVSGGYAGLWMRVDGDGNMLAFDNMGNRGVTGTTDWTPYTIQLDYKEEEATAIYLGALLTGHGKIWIDNLEVLLDGKDITQAPSLKKVLSGAALDTVFRHGSGIVIGNLTPEKVGDLTYLGMLWGFLKYHHPAIAAGKYNWDAELFRVLSDILSSGPGEAQDAILEKWIDGLGAVQPCQACKPAIKDSNVKIMPDYGYVFSAAHISEKLRVKLNYIRDNRNQGQNYYVSAGEGGVGNPEFKHENPYSEMAYPDAGYRLLALYRYWNMIQYFFPDKHLIGEDWNKVLGEFIPKFTEAKDSLQYSLACLEIIARIHDTHANIWGRNKALEAYRGKYFAPVQAKFIGERLVVTNYYRDSSEIRKLLKIGDVIARINHRDVAQLVKDNLYLVPASNYETQLRDLPVILLRGATDTVNLDILRDGQTFKLIVPRYEAAGLNRKIDYDPAPDDSSFKIINKDIGYIFPGKYKNTQLSRIKEAFQHTRGIIVDMRTYPSDFMPFSFGAFIKPAPSPFVRFSMGSTKTPGLFVTTPPLSNGNKNSGYYKGPVVVIVNATTQSQAEYTTIAFQSAPDVTVIGSTTAGADGNVSSIQLPGGISTLISGIGIYYPDGRETQRAGVRIDKIIKPTIEGIRAGKDELLEEAIAIINAKTGH